MDIRLDRIVKVFADVAMEEDSSLRSLCNEGIFFMPELAFAYKCGKRLIMMRDKLFPGLDVKWRRELKIGDSGICDLIIDLPKPCVEHDAQPCIVVEFKMRATSSQYHKDIQKLATLQSECRKDERSKRDIAGLFCALVDSWSNDKQEERIEQIEKTVPHIQRIYHPHPRFSTLQDRYAGNIDCIVATWLVGEQPNWVSDLSFVQNSVSSQLEKA